MDNSHSSALIAKGSDPVTQKIDEDVYVTPKSPAPLTRPEFSPSIYGRILSIRPPTFSPSTRRKIDVLIISSVIAITAAVWMDPDLINLGRWGYLGAFIINVVSTATILLPAPGIAAILALADRYDPTLLGAVTGFGGAVGSLTAYWLGFQGQRFIKDRRLYRFLVAMMGRFGGLTLFLFSFLFFMPADIASIIAGATRYPVRRYFVYVSAGHILKMIIIFWVFNRYFGSFEILF